MSSAEHIAAIALGIVAALGAVGALVVKRRRSTQAPLLKFNTESGTVRIYTIRQEDGRDTRVMDVDGALQSATFVDDDICYELVFDYHKAYDRMFDAPIAIRDVLMLGGGGYAYPEHLVSTHPEIRVDVVELDPTVTAIARRYFFLDRLIVEFDTDQTGRLGLFCDDARHHLETNAKTYDAICNDCFCGRKPVTSLATLEAARLVHARLNRDGIFLSNVIGSMHGERARFVHAVMATLEEVFAHVYILPGKPHSPSSPDNNIVIATDGDWQFRDARTLAVKEHARILTDATVAETDWTIPFAD